MSYKLREAPQSVPYSDPLEGAIIETYNDQASAATSVKARYPGCTVKEAMIGAGSDLQAIYVYQTRVSPDPWAAYPVYAQPAKAFLIVEPTETFNPSLWA